MAAPLKFYPLSRSPQLPDNTHELAPQIAYMDIHSHVSDRKYAHTRKHTDSFPRSQSDVIAGDGKRRGERSRTDGKVKNKMNRLLLESHMGAHTSDTQTAMEMTDINSAGEMETVDEPYVLSLKTISSLKPPQT